MTEILKIFGRMNEMIIMVIHGDDNLVMMFETCPIESNHNTGKIKVSPMAQFKCFCSYSNDSKHSS